MVPSNTAAASPSEQDALRADIYRLLARLLLAPPDRDLLGFLASLEGEGESESGPLAECWNELAMAAAASDPDTAAQAHFRHLVGVIQGEITPYASWYLHGTLMDEPLVTVRRDLRRLGIGRAESSRDPEDHLAALCEVMAILIDANSSDQMTFFQTHLAPWAESCLADLARVDTALYACTGRLGLHFIEQERREIPPLHVSPVRLMESPP
ncbi:TorD/DmsD family molecular chaperone [Halomonas sp. BC04]|uniref:TorD/DmsD family molecular chaperone n=1 Tax=Halomonas sp. BC04 TaxID=1403540 RepID=UPI0003ED8939|nr:molecular chaperone TorD family protein [Halomonas sp. BC04]EWH03780.1 molecular chaperone TorD [Halomonas sp. BC04]